MRQQQILLKNINSGLNIIVFRIRQQYFQICKHIGYCIIGRNYDFDQPDSVLQKFEETIFGQDQRIVESQRPEQVPFDLADELHLKFDAVAIAYRKAMHAQGLDLN